MPPAISGPHRQRVAEGEREDDREHDRRQVGQADGGRDDQPQDLADRAAGQAVDGRVEGGPVEAGGVTARVGWGLVAGVFHTPGEYTVAVNRRPIRSARDRLRRGRSRSPDLPANRVGHSGADVFRRSRNGTNGGVGQDGPAPGSQHLIDLRSVVKDYVTDAGPFRALDGVDLQVDRGEFIAVVGRSGCGKSTLMNMITGIDRATGGTVTVARPGPRRPVRGQDRRVARAHRRRDLPVLPAAADADRGRERDAADGLRRAVDAARAPRPGDGPARARGHGRPGAQAPVEHVGRAAAARGDRPRAGQRPAADRRRRAHRQPRLRDRRHRVRRCSSRSSTRAGRS